MTAWGPVPPPPPPRRGNGCLIAGVIGAVAVVFAALLVVGALVWVVGDGDDDATPEEVFLEPISTSREPFTAPVGTDASVTSTAGGTAGAVAASAGDQPGLYGGTRDSTSCDRGQLVRFLEGDPAKARAWAEVVGIDPGGIREFVDRLTPVVLRTDTRVTNHGYRDGEPTEIPAVLQAGTAVLVDERGQPVTKCYCGNPLTPPRPAAQRYTGARWTGFSPDALTVVTPSTVVIEIFVLVDITTGETFGRPTGTDGGDDGPAPTGGTTTTAPGTTAPATTEPPTTDPPDDGGAAESGSYPVTVTVAEGSDGSCVAYEVTFDVTVSGSGDDRTVEFGSDGNIPLSGPLAPDGSFDLSGGLDNGQGTQTLTGRFTDGGIEGRGTVESGGLLCIFDFTGRRAG